jgi:copper chaperone CopZ
MTTTYTPEELTKIAGAVMVSGMAVAMVDVGIVSSAIEASAMAQEIAGAAKKYPANTVIQTLFSEEAAKELKETPAARMELKVEEMKPENCVDTAIAKLNEALAILKEKATAEEIEQYKEFVYACCDRVANAAGSGLFGSGNPKVSETEAAAMAKIKAALG